MFFAIDTYNGDLHRFDTEDELVAYLANLDDMELQEVTVIEGVERQVDVLRKLALR